jgi:integrase
VQSQQLPTESQIF